MTGVEERAVDHAEALTASLNKRGLVDPGDHDKKLESQSTRSLSIEPMAIRADVRVYHSQPSVRVAVTSWSMLKSKHANHFHPEDSETLNDVSEKMDR